MDIDLSQITPALRYKLLVGLVVPRPIACISTHSGAGLVNLASFSCLRSASYASGSILE